MKKFLLGTVGLVALSMAAPASAADLAARPYRAAPPPMVAAVYDWSGFYIGANGGWGSSRKCWDAVTAAGVFSVAEGCHDATGGVAGGQIGYRWQAGTWVFGLEAQGDWADLKGSNVSLAFPLFTNQSRIDAFGMFTGQVGYASNDDTRWGGVVGVGVEYGFAPNWSAAIEYDHMFMQDKTHTFTNNGVAGVAGTLFGTDRIRQDVDLVTVRVNYRWGGPVVARY